jgi:hypothetical protein
VGEKKKGKIENIQINVYLVSRQKVEAKRVEII